MKIKVLLADDHVMMRGGLRMLLEQHAELAVVGEAEDGRETVRLAKKLLPDVVVMDIAMPDMNGIEATRQLFADRPGVKVIALSMHSDRHFVSEMLKAGATAYLLKQCAVDELITAIKTVLKNQTYLSPCISGVVVDHFVRNTSKSGSSVFSQLSDREREVLQLITEGKTSKEIASQLNLSIKTVEAHRMNIMEKLDIHTVAELTKYAIREGLTSL
ncbi:MAG TPA: response regulator transcription factor [Nitrospirota bacterium]|nr:response regulator transcription factor [Nitrospirota bacterium]